MKKVDLTAIVLAKNEAEMLPACLSCLSWCQEIVVIDTGSQDKTSEIAENFGAKVIAFQHFSFARLREEGLKRTQTSWIFYVDADERVTPVLAQEIITQLEKNRVAALQLKRENVFYGQTMKAGGWQMDEVTRIFKRDNLKSWQGEIHESPVFTGETLLLQSPLIHLTHRSTAEGLIKSSRWTPIEAKLLFEAGAASVSFGMLIRKGLGEFVRRAITNRGYRDGQTGLVEALIQAINRILVYVQVWELQHQPKIKDLYQVKEREIELLWEDDRKRS